KTGDFYKWIEICRECLCICSCRDCVSLVVDADWLETVPDDLLLLWAQMAQYDIDCNKNIKRKTIGPHTTEWFGSSNPLDTDGNLQIIKKYAGPNGTAWITLTL